MSEALRLYCAGTPLPESELLARYNERLAEVKEAGLASIKSLQPIVDHFASSVEHSYDFGYGKQDKATLICNGLWRGVFYPHRPDLNEAVVSVSSRALDYSRRRNVSVNAHFKNGATCSFNFPLEELRALRGIGLYREVG